MPTPLLVRPIPVPHSVDYEAPAQQRPVARPEQPEATGADEVLADLLSLHWHSPNTVAAYRADLADYFGYCQRLDLDPLAAARRHVVGYLQHATARGLADATLSRRLVALRRFYGLAASDHGLQVDPTERLRIARTRQARRVPALTARELDAFLRCADSATPRTAGLAWLLATTGLRISEACNAHRANLSLPVRLDRDLGIGQQQTDGSSTAETWLEVTCKGRVRRSVAIHPATWQRLAPLADAGGPLFATTTGRCLDRTAAARALRQVADRAQIQTPFSPHVLRHTFITLARGAGCALEDVQEAAGHADPATTRGYDRTLTPHTAHPSHAILASLDAALVPTRAAPGPTPNPAYQQPGQTRGAVR